MSASSDSEEFFDAEDNTPNRLSRQLRQKDESLLSKAKINPNSSDEAVSKIKKSNPSEYTSKKELSENTNFIDPLTKDESEGLNKSYQGRHRFRELRQKMQTDEDESGPPNSSPPDSQASSVDGIFAVPVKTTHPFRIIEHDAISLQSMTSLGRVGRILGGVADPSVSSQIYPNITSGSVGSMGKEEDSTSDASSAPSQTCNPVPNQSKPKSKQEQWDGVSKSVPETPNESSTIYQQPNKLSLFEPDVLASTKSQNNISSIENTYIPVAPPRRKKKGKTKTPNTLPPPSTQEPYSQCALPSPASTIESITREFEHSLDLRSAIKGEYVVKPQDEEKLKAQSHSIGNDRLERFQKELGRSSTTNAGTNSVGRNIGPRSHLYSTTTKERRRSAGDELGLMAQQLNMFVRTRTDSGKQLSDLEILEQVTVLNLDTGEKVPLSIAEDKLPQCINPLSLHIMRLTSEYVSNSSLDKEKESDEESIDKKMTASISDENEQSKVRRKTAQLKKFLGSKVKKTMHKAKSIAQEVSQSRHREDLMEVVDEVHPGEQTIKLKASGSHKGPYEFDGLQLVQDLSGEHVGPVWCMKFSACGRLLATAGQDRVLRIWVVRNAYSYFQDMRTKYNAEKVSPTPSQESLVSQHSSEDPNAAFNDLKDDNKRPFMPKPFCTYTGHTSDLLDVSWSKNYFVLSSSMDKTVRLWHISRKECLCCFQHIDFVTAIVFHPRDDRYFLSGSLDGKLRLWNIPDKKVAVWNEVDGQPKLITAANFCQNGKFAVVGSYDGRCIFYNTDQLKYHTQIHVRSTRGKNSTGRKISGIEPMPGEDKILVTSNDSRIRLYDLRDLNLSCKYKGYVNVSSQIKASFSHDGKYIISGSENQCIYIWKTHHDYSKFSSVRRDRNDFWEGIKAHNAVVTCAVFAPNPENIICQIEEKVEEEAAQQNKDEDPMVAQRMKGCGGYVLVSADFTGGIKVFLNKTKPKHSSLPASALA